MVFRWTTGNITERRSSLCNDGLRDSVFLNLQSLCNHHQTLTLTQEAACFLSSNMFPMFLNATCPHSQSITHPRCTGETLFTAVSYLFCDWTQSVGVREGFWNLKSCSRCKDCKEILVLIVYSHSIMFLWNMFFFAEFQHDGKVQSLEPGTVGTRTPQTLRNIKLTVNLMVVGYLKDC